MKQLQVSESDLQGASTELEQLASKWKQLQNQFESDLRAQQQQLSELESKVKSKDSEIMRLNNNLTIKSQELSALEEQTAFESKHKDKAIKDLEIKVDKKKTKLTDLKSKYEQAQVIAKQDPLKQQVIDDLEKERQVLNDRISKL
mmetsp:Transcript_6916/g.11119  ORF Transcript_6916/g.11119 Transcript_6916/m.11119 type:complete len:145 (-) Transcript_6916:1424-1858(-)|eukprot:CAMPEP_0170512952 /NCGR_PEP_ID=MMETSP0208-20121228/67131_1 /TAXON_ID=197538 /ORGANISM="Strombidium inclinatum, Strain S3" /LENGTH=144 /DNA_ID=CAMNT_0010796633 /DNA_START=948 /DNA_END=1382 /DNA_ORIENTATION=+